MTEKKEDKLKNLYEIEENEFYSEPPVDPEMIYIWEPKDGNNTLYHICKRKACPGREGEAELMTMGMVDWCCVRHFFFCLVCRAELPFEGLWEIWLQEIWQPEGMAS